MIGEAWKLGEGIEILSTQEGESRCLATGGAESLHTEIIMIRYGI